jgi:two-component system OmpR family sensor kinase
VRSLSVRIPVLAMGVLAISLFVAALTAYELLLVAGRNDLDTVLRREVSRFRHNMERITRDLLGREDGLTGLRTFRRAVIEYMALHPSNESYLVVVRIDGDVLSSPGGPEELVRLRDRQGLPTSAPGEIETLETPLGQIRSLSSRVTFQEEPVATFQVAGSMEPIRTHSLRELGRMAGAGMISLALGGALLTLVLRRALVPLRRLASTARSIELAHLGKRVPEPEGRDEVAVLAGEFNRMLQRLECAARNRQELFAAASHELRTPITIARGHIETLEAASRDGSEAVSETVAVVREELVRMGRLVEDLMALARSETQDFVIMRPVALPAFFDDLRLRLAGLGMESVTVHPPPDVTIRADPDRLVQAVLNLVVNARMHNPEGTRVEVGVTQRNGSMALVVRDDGRGIPPSIRDRAFDPFVRGPDEEDQSSTGLGLAVVQAVIAAHAGTVDLLTGDSGTTVTLRIPPGGSNR